MATDRADEGAVEGAADEPTPLPRGRHRLSREQVARSQRDRILRAVADAMAQKGYAKTSVADVLRLAGVSRETFYQQFSSKEDCFMSAYEAAVAIVLSRTGRAAVPTVDGRGGRDDRLHVVADMVGAYLDALASEPAFARLFLVEVYAAGPTALQRRADSLTRFSQVVAQVVGADDDDGRFACEAVVAAISSLVTMRVATGDLEGLVALREPLVALAGRLIAVDPIRP